MSTTRVAPPIEDSKDVPVAVTFEGVRRDFKGGVQALKGVDLAVHEREFLTLLGPSGCGKTTLLRIAAGFDRPTAGRVLLDGRDMVRIPAHRLPINMVFQRSTLFPHLDVFDNVAFGLRLDKVDKSEREQRVREALALVKLDGYERRSSDELSGGQIQRVALARALVKRPKVLLLDEPLSALDLKIRLSMERELRRIHRETQAVFIYVTHDQREALAISDRIAVFDQGRIAQLGTPSDVYRRPDSPFVAGFVGDANVLPVELEHVKQQVAELRCGTHRVRARCQETLSTGAAWLVLRPEQVRVHDDMSITGGLRGVVHDVAYRGTGFTYGIAVDGVEGLVKAEPSSDRHSVLEIGSEVVLSWDAETGRVLPRESETSEPPSTATDDVDDR